MSPIRLGFLTFCLFGLAGCLGTGTPQDVFGPSGAGASSTTNTTTVTPGGNSTIFQGLGFVPNAVAFGSLAYGTTSGAQSVVVTNTSAVALYVASLGSGSTEFAVASDNCPRTPTAFAAGASCTVHLTFGPNAVQSFTGTLYLNYDVVPGGSADSQVIGLTGSGTSPFAGLDTIDQVTGSSFRLNWTTVGAAQNYLVLELTSGSPVLIATLGSGVSTYSVYNRNPSTTYRFSVQMINGSGISDQNPRSVNVTTTSFVPGTLDTGYGTNGYAASIASFPAMYSTTYWWTYPQVFAMQTDGKVISGLVLSDNSGVAVARWNTNGTLDTTFGSSGIARIPLTDGDQLVGLHGFWMRSDGSFFAVVEGYAGGGTTPALCRVTSTGALDTTYHASGCLKIPGGQCGSFAFQTDEKFLCISGGGYPGLDVKRFNTDGTVDTSFGGTGEVTAGNYDQSGNGFVQSDGKIVVGGVGNGAFTLMRLNSDGSYDTSFAGGGFMRTTNSSNPTYGGYVARAADGSYYIGGTLTDVASRQYFGAAHVSATGVLDTTFGTTGLAQFSIGTGNDVVQAMVLDASGRLILAGSTTVGATTQPAMARLLTSGVLDASFGNGGDGRETLSMGSGSNELGTIQLTPGGQIIGGGKYYQNSGALTYQLYRFWN